MSEQIIGACIEIHRGLGPGLLESAYFGIGLLVNFNVSLLEDGLRRLTHKKKELVCAPRLPDSL